MVASIDELPDAICSPSPFHVDIHQAKLVAALSLDPLKDDNSTSLWPDYQNFTSLDTTWLTNGTSQNGTTHQQLPAAVVVPTGIALYVLSLLTFVGNAMVLHAIRTEKRLQTVSNMFIMSLALADLTVGLIVMPISSAYAITGDWKFGYVVCQFWLSVDYTASTASIFNLSILSLDRYWSITSPLRYLRRRTKKRALIMIGLAWVGASMWFIPVLGWHHLHGGQRRKLKGHVCETEFATNMTFKVVTSIINFYIPTICMTVLYVRIFLAIKRRSQDIARFGAYTASGTSACGNASKSQTLANLTLKRANNHRVTSVVETVTEEDQLDEAEQNCDSLTEEPETVVPKMANGSSSHHHNSSAIKTEFHRLAVVAFPMQPKANNNHRKIISHNNSSSSSDSSTQTLQPRIKKDQVSCESLSVFDGVTVRVEYIGDQKDQQLSSYHSNDLLLGLEERKKRTAEDSPTVPLRQPLSANYRDRVVLHHHHQVRQSSFIGPSHGKGCSGARRHSRHIHCYRSKKTSHDKVEACSQLRTVTIAAPPDNTNSVEQEFSVGQRFLRDSRKRLLTLFGSNNHGDGSSSRRLHNDVRGQPLKSSSTATRANPNAVLAKEKKAATQLGVIVGAFILCWLPYFTLFMVVAYCGENQCVNNTVFTVTIWFGYFNSTLNPILYPLCNANFKRAFKRMLHLTPDQQTPPLAPVLQPTPHAKKI